MFFTEGETKAEHDEVLREPLVRRHGSQVTMSVARGSASLFSSPGRQEMQVPSLGWEDPLEKEMATHSSILAWEIP